MDDMSDMDDIDFWPFEGELTIRLKQQPDTVVADRPDSSISTLPSEDEMMIDYFDDSNVSYVPLASYPAYTSINNGIINNDNIIIKKCQGDPIQINSQHDEVISHSNSLSNDEIPVQDCKLEVSSEQYKKNELKREKNRQSAKRSRERKREEENELRQKHTLLGDKNAKLWKEVELLRFHLARMKVCLKHHSCGIQEEGDNIYNETGDVKSGTWTSDDAEVVNLIDSLNCPEQNMKCDTPSPDLKFPLQEVQYESQSIVYSFSPNVFNGQDRVPMLNNGVYDAASEMF